MPSLRGSYIKNWVRNANWGAIDLCFFLISSNLSMAACWFNSLSFGLFFFGVQGLWNRAQETMSLATISLIANYLFLLRISQLKFWLNFGDNKKNQIFVFETEFKSLTFTSFEIMFSFFCKKTFIERLRGGLKKSRNCMLNTHLCQRISSEDSVRAWDLEKEENFDKKFWSRKVRI